MQSFEQFLAILFRAVACNKFLSPWRTKKDGSRSLALVALFNRKRLENRTVLKIDLVGNIVLQSFDP